MRYAIYVRPPKARTFISQGTVPIEEERTATRAAYKLIPRGATGDVEVFPVPDTRTMPATFTRKELDGIKRGALDQLVAEAAKSGAAGEAVAALNGAREFKAGPDAGLAHAVARLLRADGRRCGVVVSFDLFGTDPSQYSVSLY